MTFTASNGVIVHDLAEGIGFTLPDHAHIGKFGINADKVSALREFFRHERDEELGRWRWPEHPDYVVYPDEDGAGAIVLDERTGSGAVYSRALCEGTSAPMDGVHAAAHAYFEAHPERKPWHDAKSGEAWVLTVDSKQYPWGVGDGVDAGRFVYLGGLSNIPLDHPSITAGHRIWPKEES